MSHLAISTPEARWPRVVDYAAAMRSSARRALFVMTTLALAACHRDGAPASNDAEAEATPLAIGALAPDFEAVTQDGTVIKPSAKKGRPLVLYFYPKDETPGCTKEACSFRDAWNDLAKTNVLLVGISTDSAESHAAFAKHHELPFSLVSDASGAIARAYGVPNRAGFLARQTIVIGKDGRVQKIYRAVDVSRHASELLADLRE